MPDAPNAQVEIFSLPSVRRLANEDDTSVNEPEIPAAVNTPLLSKEETLVLKDELVSVNEPEIPAAVKF